MADTGRGIDLTQAWSAIDRYFMEHLSDLYELMSRLDLPLYVATTLEEGAGDGEGDGSQPMIFRSVEAACRAVSAMADYRRFLDSRS